MIENPRLTKICSVFNDWDSFILMLRIIDEVMVNKENCMCMH